MAMPALRYAAQKETKKTTQYEQRQLDFTSLETNLDSDLRSNKSYLQLAVHNVNGLNQVDLPLAKRKTSALSGQSRQGLIQQYQTQAHYPMRKRQPLKRFPSPRSYMSEHPWISDIGVVVLLLMPYILIAQK